MKNQNRKRAPFPADSRHCCEKLHRGQSELRSKETNQEYFKINNTKKKTQIIIYIKIHYFHIL